MSKAIYVDSAEEQLLRLFAKTSVIDIDAILADNPSWPILYHLSPQRENLLEWYPFSPTSTLLEIGAGCGALTGLFCRRVASVVANELTEQRATVIRRRYRNMANLTVSSGNIETFSATTKFDYITLIGVLEYAGKYMSSPDADQALLRQVISLLGPSGTLILAIENKLGLKYWSGAHEDHTGRLFDSIESYPISQGIKTYGRAELTQLLQHVGFSQVDFYYPLPDYKLPREIFSDDYLPNHNHPTAYTLYPSPAYSLARAVLFNERRVADTITANNIFGDFANSFLVFAKIK